MKQLIAVALIVSAVSVSAGMYDFETNDSRPYKDSWGNSYKYKENLYKDSDGDGVINQYDYRDHDARVRTKSDAGIYPSKKRTDK